MRGFVYDFFMLFVEYDVNVVVVVAAELHQIALVLEFNNFHLR